jgi:hypothetical protein
VALVVYVPPCRTPPNRALICLKDLNGAA